MNSNGHCTLSTRDLAIGYPRRHTSPVVVAESLELALNRGEFVCLLGPNGAGKSTLIRTLVGMQPALSGEVSLQGNCLHRMDARQLARRLSVVLTERVSLGSMTAYAVAALGRHPHTNWLGRLTPADERIVHDSLAAAGATALANRFIGELSDGERQKVMVARALAQEPEAMVLDEPTAFLDLPRRVELMRLLRRLAHETGKAILCSTHDLDLALRCADRVWLMTKDGTFHAGAPEDLVLNGTFAEAFGADGIEFDAMAGSFLVHSPHGGKAELQGDGVTAVWTRRALERAGFEVVGPSSGRVAARVTAVAEPATGASEWQWSSGQGTLRVRSLAELVDVARAFVEKNQTGRSER
jgi:iron complex transport system ATP-binding protein